jgi:heat shock protein HslJ
VKHHLTVTLPTLALLLVACSAIGGQTASTPPSSGPSSSAAPSASPTLPPAPSVQQGSGPSTPPGTAPATGLDGRQFVSITVEKNGTLQPLVSGTKIRLTFSGGSIGASAGCNSMSGDYSITGDKLVVGELATTEMGCPADLQAQDVWLAGLLAAHPQFALQGSNLVLSSDGTVVTLLDREVAEPDQPLVGITWGLTTIIDGDIASSVPAGVSATILFTADGKVQFDSGCNAGGGNYTVDGDSLHFAQIVATTMACPDPRGSVETAVRAVLDGDPIKFSIDGTTLTLQVGDKSLQYDAAVDVTSPLPDDSLPPR